MVNELTPDKFLSHSEAKRLITIVEDKAAADRAKGRLVWPRIEMMVRLALGTGLRVSELTNVMVMDCNLDKEPCVFVANGKGNKSRHVFISCELKNQIRNYQVERPGPG